ncbi:two pore domain potassium channel family protein [Leptolyngbya sp. FACHB-261]|uniref:two pore domain potassium channel family protein n=1 Tax=Leptolyngbya sp. FACHB-261 TaxID=2692806 RepID=UPI001688B83A|nr:two pore domain potassium channel family protein [Leptolyngbya sp. FACHB-261]MBD2103073.1 two pore domain potassium channel family protein [Leptolyngbya sp. FACHB-261]
MQIALISLAIVIGFAFCYWLAEHLDWGHVLTREGKRETAFAELLYFSMGTFFRIGYGDQVPTDLSRWIVGLEALCNFLVTLVYIAQLVADSMERSIVNKTRERLENLFGRYE